MQNSQLVPQIFYSLAPGVKVFRVRIINCFSERTLTAPVNLAYSAANLFPIEFVQWPVHQARSDIFQLWNRMALPPRECCGETFPFKQQQFLRSKKELLVGLFS